METEKKVVKKRATTPTTKHGTFEQAFSAAQAEMQDPIKNSLNPHFKSEYVDLGTLMACVRPVLAKHGLTIHTHIQPAFSDRTEWVGDEKILGGPTIAASPGRRIETQDHTGHRITAEISGYGKNITSSIHCPPQKNVQAFASFHTYARRWLIGGLCGVAEAKDDDGNSAVERDPKQEILNRARR